jgi:Domain of unknown function DUF29
MAKVLERSLYQTDYYAWQTDYYAWTKQQAAALRALAEQRANTTLDLENLAKEVESLGRSDLNTMRSRVRRIIEQLLKLEYSPTAQPRLEWRDSVDEAREEIEDHITASMLPDVAADLDKLFGRARRAAASGLIRHGEREAARTLPTSCPYGLEQIVEQDWYPINRHGLVDEV